MSSRIPSSMVRRFDYRLSRPLIYTREQWEEMLVLAAQNHWDPFPVPGFSFSGYRYTVYSPGVVRDLIVDYDDFVLDFTVQTALSPPDSSLAFLSDGVTLIDNLDRQAIAIAFWTLGPLTLPAVPQVYILCFSILMNALPGDLCFEKLVQPIRFNTSSVRLQFPSQDPPSPPSSVFAFTHVNRFVVNGEPIPIP
jgi:hypothetical protein